VTDYSVYEGTRAVADAHRFDIGALERYMRANIEGFRGPLRVEQFKGGQSNPTYRLAAGDGKAYVMRRKPPGKLLPSAHAVDREYRVITALAKTGFPVARSYALCTDESVIGTMFYVMDCVDGRVLWDPQLPGIPREERAALFDEMNRVIAQLHTTDYAAIGLGDYGKPGNYFQRQIDRWSRQYKASETEPIEAMDRLIEWLPRNVPAIDATSIVHGDFRVDNMIFHKTEPRVLAVIDWELSTLGHPLADFSYHMMAWRLSSAEYRGLRGCDLAAMGIPTESEYLARYLERTGLAAPSETDWTFCMAYNMFRAAAIFQGVMARALAGNAASERAMETGRRARPMAGAGWSLVQDLR
jgi:aminoglycoside phosphotransferase (APT) family kinase protein